MGRLSGNQKMRILFLSTYPPRACGIATFTQDLVGELAKTGEIEPGIAAVSNGGESYPPEVKFDLNQQDPEAYPDAAEKINRSGADLLMVEHEYGIYGGPCGSFLLKLTGALKLPYCVTLHTVLPEPSKRQRDIVHGLGSGCEKLVTMAPNTVETLKTVYGVDPEKIAVIHHGVPNLDVPGRDRLKRENGLEGRFIVSTFGLLGPGKGLEYGIEATARVAKKHPEVLYLILGQTHPDIRRREGEKYREKLERTVENFGISRNVRFVNRYLTKEEIIRYLSLSDVYMTPYLGKDQAVSGTLAYAVGYGRVIVSTPYSYARVMLADGRGLLAEFRDAGSLAARICEVLEHPDLKAKMERKTLALGRTMRWNHVAENYLSTFRGVLASRGKKEAL